MAYALISNTKGEGKEGDPFWTKAETLLYCAMLGYIIFEGAEEDRNMNTLVDMISGMEVKEDDEDFLNAVDYMFKGLEQRKPNCFAVKQYKKYKLSSGVVCSKRLPNRRVLFRSFAVLLHGEAIRLAFGKAVKHIIHSVFIVFVILLDLHAGDHVHQRIYIPILGRPTS